MQQVFQNRRLLHPFPKNCIESTNLIGLSQEERFLISSFTSDVFLVFNSSPFGDFSKKFYKEQPSILQNVDSSFFEAFRCHDYPVLIQKIHCFDNDYNRCLKEALKI